jgi:hypothetical protein
MPRVEEVPPASTAHAMDCHAATEEEIEHQRRRTVVDELMNDDVEPWVSKPAYDIYDDSETILIDGQRSLRTCSGMEEKDEQDKRSQQNNNVDIDDDDDEEEEQWNRTPSTYGEVTSKGARQLFHHMGMMTTTNNSKNIPSTTDDEDDTTISNHNHQEDDKDDIVFVDLGSGRGKLVMQAFMELPRIIKATGIELGPGRHRSAVAAWEELQGSARILRSDHHPTTEGRGATIPDAEVEFLLLDLLQSDLSQATHIYIASLCFPDALMHHIARKLGQDAPKLQCVATLRQFPRMESFCEKRGIRKDSDDDELVTNNSNAFKGMRKRSVFVEMTWTKRMGGGCEVHLYTKAPPPPLVA